MFKNIMYNLANMTCNDALFFNIKPVVEVYISHFVVLTIQGGLRMRIVPHFIAHRRLGSTKV